MTVRIPPSSEGGSSEVYTIDFRETAPALANSTMYADDPAAARWGGLAVGVPGEVRGLQEAHERWGKLPWTRLVQPSIDLAAGWAVDKELARRLQVKCWACESEALIDYTPSRCLQGSCFLKKTGELFSPQRVVCCLKAKLLDGRITHARLLLSHPKDPMCFTRFDIRCGSCWTYI